jgi:pyrimidine deaminase RibD-like protein
MLEEDWKTITPENFVVSVEHIRRLFSEGVWKASQITEKLGFAELHPNDKPPDLNSYESVFPQYLKIVGLSAQQEFDRNYRLGTPPAIFHAFQRAFAAGIRCEIRKTFSDLLRIGVAHPEKLKSNPVEWARDHLRILLGDNAHLVKLWVKSVCDRHDVSMVSNNDQDFENFIFWRDWRAPKLIYMQPSGNLPYDPSTAWNREDEPTTEKLLNGLSSRFMQFLGFDLDKMAGDAHVELAQSGRIITENADERPKDIENNDRRFAAMAIEEASKSVPEDNRPHPKVGAVVVKDGKVLSKAHRGEKEKSHAEYIAMENKLPDDLIAGSTVYTTLEPCTTRRHPKIPCAQRLIDRKVACVVIGMFDPNPDIWGKGWRLLREAGIETRVFDDDLMKICEEMNREFIRAQTNKTASGEANPTKDPAVMNASRSLTDATWKLQKAAWSFFALHTQFGVARAARDVFEEEQRILELVDSALTVFTQDYDLPGDLLTVAKTEMSNINIALANLKAFSMTGQPQEMEVAAVQIQDACERVRNAAKPYAYRSSV